MTTADDWSALIHGPCVVLPVSVAAWLNDRYRLDLLRGQVRGIDPVVDKSLMAITQAAKAWRLSDSGTIGESLPEPDRQLVSTQTAARILGTTDRAVRAAIHRRQLHGERVEGRWQIARHDIENYRIARRNRAA